VTGHARDSGVRTLQRKARIARVIESARRRECGECVTAIAGAAAGCAELRPVWVAMTRGARGCRRGQVESARVRRTGNQRRWRGRAVQCLVARDARYRAVRTLQGIPSASMRSCVHRRRVKASSRVTRRARLSG